MFGYVTRRVLSAIPIALIAVTACFFILRLAPGGPFDAQDLDRDRRINGSVVFGNDCSTIAREATNQNQAAVDSLGTSENDAQRGS